MVINLDSEPSEAVRKELKGARRDQAGEVRAALISHD
jgi:hypothetical protein